MFVIFIISITKVINILIRSKHFHHYFTRKYIKINVFNANNSLYINFVISNIAK